MRITALAITDCFGNRSLNSSGLSDLFYPDLRARPLAEKKPGLWDQNIRCTRKGVLRELISSDEFSLLAYHLRDVEGYSLETPVQFANCKRIKMIRVGVTEYRERKGRIEKR